MRGSDEGLEASILTGGYKSQLSVVRKMDDSIKKTPVDRVGRSMPYWKQLLSVWKTWVLIFTPAILLPVPFLYPGKAGLCAYSVLIMAVYWTTEALPIAVTALLPFALMPWLGVISAKDIALNYLKDTNFLFFGGLLVAVAIEKCNLHKRIALRVLLLVGSKPVWLIFGFMVTTAFLSMWLSNTATTAMMVPIAQAVLMELKQNNVTVDEDKDHTARVQALANSNQSEEPLSLKEETHIHTLDVHEDSIMISKSTTQKSFNELCKGLTLCICYAANIGGVGTLTGTGPNLIIKGQLDTLYGSEHGLNFTSWMLFACPIMVLCLLFAWIWICLLFLGPRYLLRCLRGKLPNTDVAGKVIRQEYDKLGPMSFAEIATAVHFTLLALLWLTRDPEFMDGWGALFEDGYVTDACVGVSIAVLLFAFPAERPNILCLRKPNNHSCPGPVPSLLDWETVHQKMAWSVIIVLGGGFALADATQKSGLSEDIGNAFNSFDSLTPWVLVFILCFITAGVTEVASNTATATIFLPILAQLGESIGVNPLYLMMPVAVSASFAFMLPVATPPNAIVFAYGHMKIVEMVKCGAVMNILCILVLTLGVNTWGYAYFNFGTLPSWASQIQPTELVINATTMLT